MKAARMDGKRVLLTGALGGLGAPLAKRFVAEGARVLMGDLPQATRQGSALDLGRNALLVTLDVTCADSWRDAFDLAATHWGGVDVLVNNAGIASGLTPVDQREPSDWDRIMAVNLRGPFLGIRSAIPAFRAAGGGVIVNVSSLAGLGQSGIMDPAYACSKAGLTMLTRVVAAQHAKDGIRCNSVHPGPVNTPLARAAYSDEAALERRLSRIPAGRFAEIDEVVAAVLYLASDESSYITGVALGVDGGALVQ